MATKYTLTTAFTAITETSGTIQNVGNESVELASSTNAVAGEGIVLNPGEKRSFKGTLSARSIGDAGAEVNVVDFTEAGEGGEEYILPIASDTTLGGVKIGNSFTVANDGTLSIKKSGKTILGAVKSSDDEGKVTVNNDGTMTYNPLGYRQPSTAYAVGDMKYHSALPTGWYLECTTAGTSGSGDLTINSPAIGGTVTDGTVTWEIRINNNVARNIAFSGDVNDLTDNSLYYVTPSATNAPGSDYYSIFVMTVGDMVRQIAFNNYGLSWYRTKNGSKPWSAWLQYEAIVAKSLGTNGYIKYASGLILQWGKMSTLPTVGNDSTYRVNFNVSFSTAVCSVLACPIGSETVPTMSVYTIYTDGFFVKSTNATNATGITWIAIGY